MPAYWVARSKINDPVEYKKYTDLVPDIIEKFGAKVLARGGRFQIMEGPDKFHRFIVIEFPTFQQGVACFTSPEYDKAAAFRRSGAREVKTIIVQRPDRPTVDDAVVVLENTRGILTRGSRQPWLPCCEPRRSASRLSPFLLLRILGTRLLRLPVFCRCEVCQTLGSLVANCFLILSPPVGQSLPHTK
jgi:uncharacterized protein (DUF1330 family)